MNEKASISYKLKVSINSETVCNHTFCVYVDTQKQLVLCALIRNFLNKC